MSKANKATFAALKSTAIVDIEFDGKQIEFEINSVKIKDIVAIESSDNVEDRFELIRLSLIKSIPDITLEDVLELPISVGEKLIKAICELNDIDLPDAE